MEDRNVTPSKNRFSAFFFPDRAKRNSSMSNAGESTAYEDAPSSPEPRLPSQSSPGFQLRKSRMSSSSSSQANVIPEHQIRSTSTTRPGRNVSRGRDHARSRPSSKDSRGEYRSRSQTPSAFQDAAYETAEESPQSIKTGKKRAWFSSKQSRDKVELTSPEPRAWTAGVVDHEPYDLQALLHGYPLPDLWPEDGDTLVYLFPQSTGRGSSIKTYASLLEASSTLILLSRQSTPPAAQTELYRLMEPFSQTSLQHQAEIPSQLPNVPNFSMPTNNQTDHYHLYLPLGLIKDYTDVEIEPSGDDLELLVMYRNFFAFLMGGSLVCTPRQKTVYSIFYGIGGLLTKYQFDEDNEADFGPVVRNNFAHRLAEFRLADVRISRGKTIEAIVLGEYMRSWPLYYNGFVHAAGRLKDIQNVEKSPYDKISPTTIHRLERVTFEIESRLTTVRGRLQEFEFPAMFSGLANSQTSVESKIVRFKEWKSAFMAFKRYVIGYYRKRYGAWPPKPGSKKYSLEVSGLNRLVLKEIYTDFCELYDMLVDQSSLTTRDRKLLPLDEEAALTTNVTEATRHALRRVEDEYDESDVPVHPPIPFDVPLFPTFTNSFNRAHLGLSEETARSSKRLTESEVSEVLLGSYNRAGMKGSQWIKDFMEFERGVGDGKTLNDIIDLRIGQWLFVYAILQTLPLVVVDAKEVQFSDGVEHFICQAPRGGMPWVKNDTSSSRTWLDAADDGNTISQSSSDIDNSTAGVYPRSHCWKVAADWVEANEKFQDANETLSDRDAASYLKTPPFQSPYQSPQSAVSSPEGRIPSQSLSDRPVSRMSNRSSMLLGLDMMGPPASNMSRPLVTYDPDITFDQILGVSQTESVDRGKKDKKKKKGKK